MAEKPGGAVDTLAIAITGGHGELFWQRFECPGLRPCGLPASNPIAEAASLVKEAHVFGTGAKALVDARGWGEAVSLHPDAARYPSLPAELLQFSPVPLYGRGADARPKP